MDRLFALAKLRASENVIATRGGLMHAPGGFAGYLAAIWTNDQIEYAAPFFAFLGDAGGDEASLNACRWFARYKNDHFDPIPSSITGEGRGSWIGAGDRGDAAMAASGAARWALTHGDPERARELWPFIRWCLAFCESRRTTDGVIASDSDELENRFSSGRTNLATSCLTYDALISASYLADALGEPADVARGYLEKASALRCAIESFFGATLQGRNIYRYHEGLEKRRAWICLPLTVGIYDRAAAVVDTLFSPALWTDDSLLTEEGGNTFWDRSTLFALRGVFQAGFADEGLARLHAYSARRLLGDHVPYPIEAYPELNQSHLSAESALYGRILIDGICGLRPTGFDAFDCTPQLPSAWPSLSLDSIHAFGRVWNLRLRHLGDGIEVLATDAAGSTLYQATKPRGKTHTVRF